MTEIGGWVIAWIAIAATGAAITISGCYVAWGDMVFLKKRGWWRRDAQADDERNHALLTQRASQNFRTEAIITTIFLVWLIAGLEAAERALVNPNPAGGIVKVLVLAEVLLFVKSAWNRYDREWIHRYGQGERYADTNR